MVENNGRKYDLRVSLWFIFYKNYQFSGMVLNFKVQTMISQNIIAHFISNRPVGDH